MKRLLLFLGLIIILFCGCEELTEKDLSGNQVRIIAPVDSLTTTVHVNTFAWEEIKGATGYRFQIVAPRFDSATIFVTDSVSSRTNLTYTLPSGHYQWRIKPLNSGSSGDYVTRTLIVL